MTVAAMCSLFGQMLRFCSLFPSNCNDVVHHEFKPQSRTVNKEYYLDVMRRLCEAICQKRKELWINHGFWFCSLFSSNCNDVVHNEFMPQSRTINKQYYLDVMRRLRETICQKCTELWENQSWILYHDHTSMLVREFLAKNKTVIIPQPPYSPSQVLADFFPN